jgi:hypothetical protein
MRAFRCHLGGVIGERGREKEKTPAGIGEETMAGRAEPVGENGVGGTASGVRRKPISLEDAAAPGHLRDECAGLLPSIPSGHENGHGETAAEGRALRRSRVTDRCGRRMRGGRCTPASPRPAGGLRAENASVPFSETPGRAHCFTCRSARGLRARGAATAGRS